MQSKRICSWQRVSKQKQGNGFVPPLERRISGLLIEGGRYYVDKTQYLRPIFDADDRLLILRPRRFGKTLMMSTLKYFLEMNYENPGDTSAQGLRSVLVVPSPKSHVHSSALSDEWLVNWKRFCSLS